MILYYEPNGEVVRVFRDDDSLFFIPDPILGNYTIDEIQENSTLLKDLFITAGQRNQQGQTKYLVVNNVLQSRNNWSPFIP